MTSEWGLDLRHFGRLVVLLSRFLAVVSQEKSCAECLPIIVLRVQMPGQNLTLRSSTCVKYRETQRSTGCGCAIIPSLSESFSRRQSVLGQLAAPQWPNLRQSELQKDALHLFDRNAA
jgi:hypothetical protein